MRKLLLILLFSALVSLSYAQSVAELIESYSGKVAWDAEKGEMVFLTAGYITFDGKGESKQHFWDVPVVVKTIVIDADVRVTGAFHTRADCTIKGVHPTTSVVYGTDYRSWDNLYGVKAFMHCQFQNFGGTLTIKNLTSLNPFGFHVRGEGNVVMVSDCKFIDNRGGSGNHSDGIEGGDGSVIEDCYFETGDDVIKVYHDITVKNCTIKMIQNAVPIQLGWSNTGDNTANFYNLKIIGDLGRGNDDNAIIVGRMGTYTKTINIYGCDIQNPNAAWISLRGENMAVNGEVTQANVKVNKFRSKEHVGICNLLICDTTEEKKEYKCK